MTINEYLKTLKPRIGLNIIWENTIDYHKLIAFVFENIVFQSQYDYMVMDQYDGPLDGDYFAKMLENLERHQGCTFGREDNKESLLLLGTDKAYKIYQLLWESEISSIEAAKEILFKVNAFSPVFCAYIYDYNFVDYQSIKVPSHIDKSIDKKNYSHLVFKNDDNWDEIDISGNPGRRTFVQHGILIAAPNTFISNRFIEKYNIDQQKLPYSKAEENVHHKDLWEIKLFSNPFDSMNKLKELQDFRDALEFDRIEKEWKW